MFSLAKNIWGHPPPHASLTIQTFPSKCTIMAPETDLEFLTTSTSALRNSHDMSPGQSVTVVLELSHSTHLPRPVLSALPSNGSPACLHPAIFLHFACITLPAEPALSFTRQSAITLVSKMTSQCSHWCHQIWLTPMSSFRVSKKWLDMGQSPSNEKTRHVMGFE